MNRLPPPSDALAAMHEADAERGVDPATLSREVTLPAAPSPRPRRPEFVIEPADWFGADK